MEERAAFQQPEAQSGRSGDRRAVRRANGGYSGEWALYGSAAAVTEIRADIQEKITDLRGSVKY